MKVSLEQFVLNAMALGFGLSTLVMHPAAASNTHAPAEHVERLSDSKPELVPQVFTNVVSTGSFTSETITAISPMRQLEALIPGLAREDLASLLGVSRQAVHSWLKGGPVSKKHIPRVEAIISTVMELRRYKGNDVVTFLRTPTSLGVPFDLLQAGRNDLVRGLSSSVAPQRGEGQRFASISFLRPKAAETLRQAASRFGLQLKEVDPPNVGYMEDDSEMVAVGPGTIVS